MRWFPRLVVLVLLLALVPGQTAFAAPTTTAGSAAARPPLDLAAMVLFPSDIKERAHPSIYAGARYLPANHPYTGQQGTALAAAGYVGSYESWLVPAAASAAAITYQVATDLNQFQTVHGAETGFTLFTTTPRKAAAMKTIGAQSRLFILNGADPYDQNKTYQGLTLVFRIDRVVATIYLDDYTGHAPKAAEIESLGATFAARVTAGLAGKPPGPGFSNRVLRLTVDSSLIFEDNYYRLNRRDIFGAANQNAPTDTATFDQSFAGATDVYFSGESLNSSAGSPTFYTTMAGFSSTATAAKWVRVYLTTQAPAANGWQHVKAVKDGKTFGDQSSTATFSFPAAQGSPGPTSYGTVIVARSRGTAVVTVVEAFKPVPAKLVESLMATQMRCLTSTALCPSQKVPAGIQALTVKVG